MQTNMADGQENEPMDATGNNSVNPKTVKDPTIGITVENSSINEDILQQAFDGTDEFEQNSVAFSVQIEADSASVGVIKESNRVRTSTPVTNVSNDSDLGTTTYRIVRTIPFDGIGLSDGVIAQTVEPEPEENEETISLDTPNPGNVGSQQEDLIETRLLPDKNQDDDQSFVHQIQEPNEQHHTFRFTLVESNQTGAPLGSSKNPIRIIQQGNQYTPVQQLTTEQLQQIMQVVQQQQLAKNTQEAGGSVLFNPNTNTRIVYRIIYPSELHKGQQTVFHVTPKSNLVTNGPMQQTLVTKRQYRRRGKDDEEDRMDGPEMSREEKEERKKHRPRTRSGRVSKPPRHMVKDYKHIHVLDWDEDYDDSDGGYSDYRGSDEEGHGKSRDRTSERTPELYSGLLTSSRPRNFRCQTCVKSYIGLAGLGRHYRLNPSHGYLQENAADTEEKETGVLTPSTESSGCTVINGSAAVGNTPTQVDTFTVASNMGCSAGIFSEDSNTQDSIPSSSGAMSPVITHSVRRGRGGCRGRGRWSYYQNTTPAKRKQKLKELVKTVEDDDLMEVVLPKLVKFVTLWEFLLMKVETCSGYHPRVDHIYQEYLTLHKQVKEVCNEGLQLKQETVQENGLHRDESNEVGLNSLNLEDQDVARSLGLTVGTYQVKDLPLNEFTSFRYKYLTSDPNIPTGVSAEKRTIQVVTPDELVAEPSSKKNRISSQFQPSVVAALAPSEVAASSLLTSIVSSSGLKDSHSKHSSQKSMFHAMPLQQQHSNNQSTVMVQAYTHDENVATVHAQQQIVKAEHLQCHPVTVRSNQLKTFTVLSPAVAKQTPVLRTVKPPVISSTSVSTPNNRPAIISLLNNASVDIVSHIAPSNTQNQPSKRLVQPHYLLTKSRSSTNKTQLLTDGHLVAAASPSAHMSIAFAREIHQSQALNTVSVLPNTELNTTSYVPCTSSDFSTVNLDDFTNTPTDSSVNCVSGLSASVNSLVRPANSFLQNGDADDLNICGLVKINGVANTPRPADFSEIDLVTGTSTVHNSQQVAVTSSIHTTSNEASVILKCGNVDVYSEVGSCDVSLSSVVDTMQEADIIRSTTGSTVTTEINHIKSEEGSFQEQCELMTEPTNQVDSVCLEESVSERPMEIDDQTECQSFTLHQNAVLFQTEDGTVILQNPDGTTFQLQGLGEQGLTLQTVQELLGHMLSTENVQANLQQ